MAPFVTRHTTTAPARRHRGSLLRTALLAAGLAAPGAASSGQAREQCGQSVPPAEIRVSAEHTFPRVSYAHASHEIGQQLGSAPPAVALGLTQSSTTLSVEVLLKAVQPPGQDMLCARPQVNVTLRHAQLEIWLAREIEHDDCVSAVVLEHEMQHVAIERDALDWAAQQLESQLQAHYGDRVLRGTEAQIKAGLARDFEEKWTPMLEILLQSSNARHAAHDKQDGYADAHTCGGTLYRTARRLK